MSGLRNRSVDTAVDTAVEVVVPDFCIHLWLDVVAPAA